MAKEGLFGQLKEVIYCLYDSNGNKRVKEIGLVADRQLSDSRLELLRNICEFVLNTDFLKEETKIYLKDRNIKYAQVNEIINENIKEYNRAVESGKVIGKIKDEVKESSTRSIIQYDRTKLDKVLGNSIITHVLLMKTVSIESYQLTVGKLLAKYKGVESLRDRVALHINDNVYRREYEGDFIEEFGGILYTYLNDTIKRVEEKINSNEDAVGYFNFLLSGVSSDSEKVIRDREKLKEILTGLSIPSRIEVETADNSELVIEEVDKENIEEIKVEVESNIEEKEEVVDTLDDIYIDTNIEESIDKEVNNEEENVDSIEESDNNIDSFDIYDENELERLLQEKEEQSDSRDRQSSFIETDNIDDEDEVIGLTQSPETLNLSNNSNEKDIEEHSMIESSPLKTNRIQF